MFILDTFLVDLMKIIFWGIFEILVLRRRQMKPENLGQA